MKTVISILLLFVACHFGLSQSPSFPFGKVTLRELEMSSYDKDTSAVAVVLNEFGEAFIENDDQFQLAF